MALDFLVPAAGRFSGEYEWDDEGSDDWLPLPQELLYRAPQVIDLTVDSWDGLSPLYESFSCV